MARTPTIYRWDDPGAPDLSALHTTNDERDLMYFHTVLKACLVTGYGAKAAAGWTMPLEETTVGGDGNRFVLTNAAGSGSLLYEGGTFSGNSSDHHADTLWACSAVLTMDTPLNAWSWNVKYADRNSQGSSDVFHKSGLRNKYACDAWVVIANENTCIIIAGRTSLEFSQTTTFSDSLSGSYLTLLTFGAMHDGFGGVADPGSGNFYIAGGGKGDYNDYSTNSGMQSDLLTSIQGVTGLAKDDAHVYKYSAMPVQLNAASSFSSFLPAPIFYTQYGPSNPIGDLYLLLSVSVVLVGLKKLLIGIYRIDDGDNFLDNNSFSWGDYALYNGYPCVFFREYGSFLSVLSLDPAEWGA